MNNNIFFLLYLVFLAIYLSANSFIIKEVYGKRIYGDSTKKAIYIYIGVILADIIISFAAIIFYVFRG